MLLSCGAIIIARITTVVSIDIIDSGPTASPTVRWSSSRIYTQQRLIESEICINNFPFSPLTGHQYWRFDEDEMQVELDYPRDMSMWKGIGYNIDSAFQYTDGGQKNQFTRSIILRNDLACIIGQT